MSSVAPHPHDQGRADRPRRPLTRRDARVDGVVALGLLGLGGLTALLALVVVDGSPAVVTGPVETSAWLVALCAPVALRRRRPLLATVTVSLVVVGAALRGYPDELAPAMALFLVISTANAWAASRRRALTVSAVVSITLFSLLLVGLARRASDVEGMPVGPVTASAVYSVLFAALFFTGAVLVGRSTRLSAERLHALERAGVDLRAAQEVVADQAIDEERSRIARELHDVVAHNVAVIGIQAGAARRTLDRPDVARGALSAVEATARTTVEELERMLRVLRTRDGSCAAPTGVADLPQLVDDTRRLGLDVRYSVEGDQGTVPESTGVTLYRVAQEALTNTLKHAHASTAVVRLRHRDRQVEIEVVDDGTGAGAGRRAAPSGTGLGHRGMRERVDLHGGELELGPLARGGYRVRAVLPVASCAEPAPSPAAAAGAPAGPGSTS
jgi:signal transduction histidine kinase